MTKLSTLTDEELEEVKQGLLNAFREERSTAERLGTSISTRREARKRLIKSGEALIRTDEHIQFRLSERNNSPS